MEGPRIVLYDEQGAVNGLAVRAVRSVLGLSIRDFADVLGVGFSTLHRWETGQASLRRNRGKLLPVLHDQAAQAERRLQELKSTRPQDYERMIQTLPTTVVRP